MTPDSENIKEKIIAAIPDLMKTCKKSIPLIRNRYVAKELIFQMTKIMKLYKEV